MNLIPKLSFCPETRPSNRGTGGEGEAPAEPQAEQTGPVCSTGSRGSAPAGERVVTIVGESSRRGSAGASPHCLADVRQTRRVAQPGRLGREATGCLSLGVRMLETSRELSVRRLVPAAPSRTGWATRLDSTSNRFPRRQSCANICKAVASPSRKNTVSVSGETLRRSQFRQRRSFSG